MIRIVGFTFLLATFGYTQDTFTPPLIGYVAGESGKAVHAIVGTPGAARVLPPLPLPPGITRVALAPGRPFGIASLDGVESLVLLHSLNTEPAASVIIGAMKSFDRAVFSAGGRAAVVYGRECGCVQAVTGLPEAPQVRTISMTDQEVIALAVNDDASLVARAIAGELALFRSNAVQTWSITAASVAISADSAALLVLDSDRKSVSLVRDPGGAAEWLPVLAEGEPVTVGFLGAATSLVVGDAVSGVRLIDSSTGQVTAAECACRPTAIERTAITDTYRLTGLDAGTVWLLRTTDSETRTLFVPVQRLDSQEPRQ